MCVEPTIHNVWQVPEYGPSHTAAAAAAAVLIRQVGSAIHMYNTYIPCASRLRA